MEDGAVIGRLIGFVLLMAGLIILFKGGSLKLGIGFTAIGIVFLMNKIYRKED
jgi:hypothetical protein